MIYKINIPLVIEGDYREQPPAGHHPPGEYDFEIDELSIADVSCALDELPDELVEKIEELQRQAHDSLIAEGL